MLGSDDTSLYVVFMGTKHVRDVVADANLLQAAVWQDEELQVISTSRFPYSLLKASKCCTVNCSRKHADQLLHRVNQSTLQYMMCVHGRNL